MWVVQRPQITEVKTHICGFHERHPGANFPGCTCSTSITSRDKPEKDWTKEERDWYYSALCGERPDGSPIFP